jgi:3-oxoacyl-[acyl-carrier-protein] synthase-3
MATGAAQPSGSLTAGEVGSRYGRTAEWIQARTGIRSLRRIRAGESLIGLAESAGADALARSGVPRAQIDLVIAATCSTRAGEPALGPQLAQRLAPDAAYFDLNSACSGFCYAVGMADGLIRAGSARHVLIVGAEHMSDLIDPTDLGTGIIFGDGAGAAVLGPCLEDSGPGGGPGVGPVAWGSDGSQSELIAFGEDDPFMRMQGQAVFRWAVENIHRVALRACELAGVSPADIDVFVPHQANLRIVDAMAKKLGLTDAVIADDITVSGNTSAASIPIAMTRLLDSGDARSGQLALLVGFGAGLAFAAQVVRLP